MLSSHPTDLDNAPLTIVLPVLNEVATLAPRLIALQPLRARGARVVVADGGSTDGTLALARQYADLALLAPRGRGAQMNAGAAAPPLLAAQPASPEGILLFLHADTALPEHADRWIQQALQGSPVWGRFDVRIDSPRTAFRVIERLMNLRSRWSGVATGDQALFVRRAAFEAVGGFEDIALMEDIALSRALRRLSRPACLRQRVTTSARRWEQHGVWRTVLLMWRLRTEAAALRQGMAAVFIPAEDGGYVLVGLNQPQPGLFQGIAWSTEHVMAQTRQRAEALGLALCELAPLWDVDMPHDLERLAALPDFAEWVDQGARTLATVPALFPEPFP